VGLKKTQEFHSDILCHKAQVLAIVSFYNFCQVQELGTVYPAFAVGYFFHAGYIQTLALLDYFHKGAGFQQAVKASGVQPGHAAAEQFNMEFAPGQVLVVYGGYLYLAPG
jgi:hypothetical protein